MQYTHSYNKLQSHTHTQVGASVYDLHDMINSCLFPSSIYNFCDEYRRRAALIFNERVRMRILLFIVHICWVRRSPPPHMHCFCSALISQSNWELHEWTGLAFICFIWNDIGSPWMVIKHDFSKKVSFGPLRIIHFHKHSKSIRFRTKRSSSNSTQRQLFFNFPVPN